MIRPQPARWFAILAARDDAAVALEALARTYAVELEAAPASVLPESLAELRPRLSQFAELSLRYRAYWPGDRLMPSAFPETPARTLDRCLAAVRAWAQDAEPIIRSLQAGAAENEELARWRRVFRALADSSIDLARTAMAGPLVRVRLFVFAPDAEPIVPARLLLRQFVEEGELHALAVGTADELAQLAQQAVAAKGRVHDMPTWLATDMRRNDEYIEQRMAALARERQELAAALAVLHEQNNLREALGNAWRLSWVLANVHALDAGDLFCWITGWTSELTGTRLAEALDASGARAIIHYPPPPAGARPPLLLANPAWAKPFEVFSRALGMPSRNEADPSVVLAIAVPLMFGYMFGDVGQGLVIAIAGFLLRKRFALARLFVVGGLAAAVFGLLFGSVFSLHLLPPLWIEPLSDPLKILWVPLVGGGVLMTLGLALRAIEAHWRGDFVVWLATDAGLIAVYLGLLVCLLWEPGFVVAGVGAAVYTLGHAWHARRWSAALPALGELAERTLQILINTLSFARVGAFALAHAGLSSALVALLSATDSAIVAGVLLVVGNVVVIVLEGLVVSIQTTRLVLFEFFTRFLVAEGRVFRPLPPPPSNLQEIPT
jgi:V/A-type H+/Na+-transporting ATPase subunit I